MLVHEAVPQDDAIVAIDSENAESDTFQCKFAQASGAGNVHLLLR
jgi:hypothetical protein